MSFKTYMYCEPMFSWDNNSTSNLPVKSELSMNTNRYVIPKEEPIDFNWEEFALKETGIGSAMLSSPCMSLSSFSNNDAIIDGNKYSYDEIASEKEFHEMPSHSDSNFSHVDEVKTEPLTGEEKEKFPFSPIEFDMISEKEDSMMYKDTLPTAYIPSNIEYNIDDRNVSIEDNEADCDDLSDLSSRVQLQRSTHYSHRRSASIKAREAMSRTISDMASIDEPEYQETRNASKKRNGRSRGAKLSSNKDKVDDLGISHAEKLLVTKRARNREASRISRERKQTYMVNLDKRMKHLETERNELRFRKRSLKETASKLKYYLELAHTQTSGDTSNI